MTLNASPLAMATVEDEDEIQVIQENKSNTMFSQKNQSQSNHNYLFKFSIGKAQPSLVLQASK